MASLNQQPLAEALAAAGRPGEITAPKAYAASQKRQAERLPYAEARADLEARARAGKTVQGRNNKGRFTRGAKVFTAGVAPVVQAPAKVEKAAPVAKVPARAPVAEAPAQLIAAEAA